MKVFKWKWIIIVFIVLSIFTLVFSIRYYHYLNNTVDGILHTQGVLDSDIKATMDVAEYKIFLVVPDDEQEQARMVVLRRDLNNHKRWTLNWSFPFNSNMSNGSIDYGIVPYSTYVQPSFQTRFVVGGYIENVEGEVVFQQSYRGSFTPDVLVEKDENLYFLHDFGRYRERPIEVIYKDQLYEMR